MTSGLTAGLTQDKPYLDAHGCSEFPTVNYLGSSSHQLQFLNLTGHARSELCFKKKKLSTSINLRVLITAILKNTTTGVSVASNLE